MGFSYVFCVFVWFTVVSDSGVILIVSINSPHLCNYLLLLMCSTCIQKSSPSSPASSCSLLDFLVLPSSIHWSPCVPHRVLLWLLPDSASFPDALCYCCQLRPLFVLFFMLSSEWFCLSAWSPPSHLLIEDLRLSTDNEDCLMILYLCLFLNIHFFLTLLVNESWFGVRVLH